MKVERLTMPVSEAAPPARSARKVELKRYLDMTSPAAADDAAATEMSRI